MKKLTIASVVMLLIVPVVFAQQSCSGSYTFPADVGVTGELTIGELVKSATDFIIEVAGVERLRILQNGNVGIGVVAPTKKLEVAGDIKGTRLCIVGDCRSNWPASGTSDPGSLDWNDDPDITGDVTIDGALTADSIALTSGSIVEVKKQNCVSGSCYAACSAGKKIIHAMLFEGPSTAFSSIPLYGTPNCGNLRMHWPGACIGLTSCTQVITCSSGELQIVCAP